MSPVITPTLFTPALAKSAVMYQGEIWTSSHLLIMPASQVHLTTLVIPIIHTVCVVGGGVRAAAFTNPVCRRKISCSETTAAIRVEPLVGGGSLVVPTGQRLRVD